MFPHINKQIPSTWKASMRRKKIGLTFPIMWCVSMCRQTRPNIKKCWPCCLISWSGISWGKLDYFLFLCVCVFTSLLFKPSEPWTWPMYADVNTQRRLLPLLFTVVLITDCQEQSWESPMPCNRKIKKTYLRAASLRRMKSNTAQWETGMLHGMGWWQTVEAERKSGLKARKLN